MISTKPVTEIKDVSLRVICQTLLRLGMASRKTWGRIILKNWVNLDNPKTFTLSRAINYLSGDAETPRQFLMAGSVIVTLPILLIFIYFEKYLVGGLTSGSIKG